MQCRKNITVEDNEERMNIANFINMYMYYIYLYIYHIYIYTNIYIYIYIYMYIMSWTIILVQYLLLSYLNLCPRQCKWKVGTTYLAIRTKDNQNIFEYKNILLLKPPQTAKSNITHCDQREKLRTIILSHLSGAFPDEVNQ